MNVIFHLPKAMCYYGCEVVSSSSITLTLEHGYFLAPNNTDFKMFFASTSVACECLTYELRNYNGFKGDIYK